MNKKFLMIGLFSILGLAMVSAIAYYAIFSTTFTVLPAVTLDGDLEQELGNVFGGEEIVGSQIDITNNAPSSRVVTIQDDSDESVDVSYVSELTLSQKVVVFGETNWVLTGDTAKVRYTVVGDSFTAEVIEGSKDGYVLAYYKDNSDRFNSPAKTILIEDVAGNLPYEDDNNNEEDYCLSDGYTTCNGAKIWYVPETAIDAQGNIDWSRASEFLFETNLVEYNAEGSITIFPESTLSITPVYNVDSHAEGEKTITTQII